jgi:hypothetical protein
MGVDPALAFANVVDFVGVDYHSATEELRFPYERDCDFGKKIFSGNVKLEADAGKFFYTLGLTSTLA